MGFKKLFYSFFSFAVLAACSHTPSGTTSRHPSSETPSTLKDGQPWDANDPALRQGDLTVWKLQEMAENNQLDQLNALFNQGVSLNGLPVGYAAGAGARALNLPSDWATKAVDGLTGKNWRGKIFFKSSDPRKSHGLNRIKRSLIQGNAPIVAMAAFTTELLDRHELAPDVTSNFVVLNYAHPKTKGQWQEVILEKIQVFDVMVAVPGKYGPVYVGKTWLGSYDRNDVFHASDPSKLIAWYFLDFNQGALEEQQNSHWDQTREVKISYE